MNKFSFLYLVFFYATASVFTLFGDVSIENQIYGCLFFIALFGIPHGAIDNLIVLSDNSISKYKFYFIYLLSIALYVILWFMWPIFSFILFLVISSYHFGESQFANYRIKSSFNKLIYCVWGTMLMSTLFYYNNIELNQLFSSFEDTIKFTEFLHLSIYKIFFYLSNVLLLIIFIILYQKKLCDIVSIRSELFQYALIHLTFYLFPVIISFTFYFIFLHSLKVLFQEYSFLKEKFTDLNFIKFIKLLLPHTLISLIFLLLFIFFSEETSINLSALLFAMISISVITLPHSVVMAKFYQKIYN